MMIRTWPTCEDACCCRWCLCVVECWVCLQAAVQGRVRRAICCTQTMQIQVSRVTWGPAPQKSIMERQQQVSTEWPGAGTSASRSMQPVHLQAAMAHKKVAFPNRSSHSYAFLQSELAAGHPIHLPASAMCPCAPAMQTSILLDTQTPRHLTSWVLRTAHKLEHCRGQAGFPSSAIWGCPAPHGAPPRDRGGRKFVGVVPHASELHVRSMHPARHV